MRELGFRVKNRHDDDTLRNYDGGAKFALKCPPANVVDRLKATLAEAKATGVKKQFIVSVWQASNRQSSDHTLLFAVSPHLQIAPSCPAAGSCRRAAARGHCTHEARRESAG